jgi:hypothetical protein
MVLLKVKKYKYSINKKLGFLEETKKRHVSEYGHRIASLPFFEELSNSGMPDFTRYDKPKREII